MEGDVTRRGWTDERDGGAREKGWAGGMRRGVVRKKIFTREVCRS